MNIEKWNFAARAAATAGTVGLALTLSLGAASAQDKIYTMKISLPTLNDPSYFFAKNYAAALEKDSGGRIKPEIYPASQLGAIPRQIEGTQFGAIQCAVIPPEFFVGVDERFELMAAPGLVSSMEHGQRLAADPEVLKLMLGLGADKGLHGVALFMNAPSSLISKTPIRLRHGSLFFRLRRHGLHFPLRRPPPADVGQNGKSALRISLAVTPVRRSQFDIDRPPILSGKPQLSRLPIQVQLKFHRGAAANDFMLLPTGHHFHRPAPKKHIARGIDANNSKG